VAIAVDNRDRRLRGLVKLGANLFDPKSDEYVWLLGSLKK